FKESVDSKSGPAVARPPLRLHRPRGGSMDEQPMQQVPPPSSGTGWQQTPPPPPNYQAAAAPAEGLSDTAAGALAYITIIPAIIFLVVAPYNTKPFVRFHAFQSIGFYVVWFCACFVIWI